MVARRRKRNQSPEPSLDDNQVAEFDAASPKVDDELEKIDEIEIENIQPPKKKLRSGAEYETIFPERENEEEEVDYATLELEYNNQIMYDEDNNNEIEREATFEEEETISTQAIASPSGETEEREKNQPENAPIIYKETNIIETVYRSGKYNLKKRSINKRGRNKVAFHQLMDFFWKKKQ